MSRMLLVALLAFGCDDGSGGDSTADARPDAVARDSAVDATDPDSTSPDAERPDVTVSDGEVSDAVPDGDVDSDVDSGVDSGVDAEVDSEVPPQCREDDECAVDNLCTDARCVDGRCVLTPIADCCAADSDCGEGGLCLADLHRCAEPVEEGVAVLTELFVDPVRVADERGEWLELTNTSDAPIRLNGWRLWTGGAEPKVIESPDALVVNPGEFFVIAADATAAVNGGVVADLGVGTLGLPDDDGRVALDDPFGTLVDEVLYDEAFPALPAVSLSLAPGQTDATANDLGENWCNGQTAWAAGSELGTPGAANPVCPDLKIDWCRLQHPRQLEATSASSFTAYARVFEDGVSNLTDATDLDPRVVIEAGVGPDGSQPDGAWTWTRATANAGWNGTTAGEPGNDEYQATVRMPSAGRYDLAFRASGDGGRTWLLCDGAAGAGADGSENGYQPENAGDLVSLAGPCDETVCDQPPAATCLNSLQVQRYTTPGLCSVVDAAAVCEYVQAAPESCGEDQVCVDGACVARPVPQVIFSEIMYDPHGGLSDDFAEWVELHNLGDAPAILSGCVLSDDGNNRSVLGDLVIEADGYAVLARTDDLTKNGGLAVDGTFTIALGNSGDSVILTCDDQIIDAVAYDDGGEFPNAQAASLNLNANAFDAVSNDDGGAWCLGTEPYYQVGDDVTTINRGTPGAANTICDTTVDWCRLQWPLDVTAGANTELSVYGWVFEDGITNRTAGADPVDALVGEVGFGPRGTEPDGTWTWQLAAPNAGFNDPVNDEYIGTFTVPAVGEYDFAFRFSRDSGASFILCDRNAGEGSDGSADGYQVENAGKLVSEASPCEGVVCDQPTAPTCDGTSVVTYAQTGSCRVDGETFACDYAEASREDCASLGGVCENGACTGVLSWPAEGEVVVTEFLYDPSLDDTKAEWFELTNVSDVAVTLTGCVMRDSANQQAIDDVILPAGEAALFGRVADPAQNGGLTLDHLFGFGLNNDTDSLSLHCGDVIVDAVTYNEAAGWPIAVSAAVQLDVDTYDAVANDAPGAWCLATQAYYQAEGVAPHLGTPGGLNDACVVVDPCDPDPCVAPPAARCDGNTVVTSAAPGECVDGLCVWTETRTACENGEVCQDGDCVPGQQIPAPAAGEVIFTELMYDPHYALDDAQAEWVELQNRSANAVTLNGCTLGVVGNNTRATVGDVVLQPGGYAMFAKTGPATNGGIAVNGTFAFSLGNSGATVNLICGATTVDAVTYDDGRTFPDARARSIALDPAAVDTHVGASWCMGRDVYAASAVSPAESHYGTPGRANPSCDVTLDWCRVQWPENHTLTLGENVTWYGRFYEAGLTDLSVLNDYSPALRAQAGIGAVGSVPAADWTWFAAVSNASYDGAQSGETANDEWQATVVPTVAGQYDVAYRVSADDGRTWTYCDLRDGSANGYAAADAAKLNVTQVGDPCAPNPCNTRPATVCDGTAVVTYADVGTCEVVDGAADCTYAEATRTDCAATGQTCGNGQCSAVVHTPGEVLITELMVDPNSPPVTMTDENSEWVELYNPGETPVVLDGCKFYSTATALTAAPFDRLVVPARGFALLGKTKDVALNGGLQVDAIIGVPTGTVLTNGGSTVTLKCGDTVIDSFTYVAPANLRRHALALSASAMDATANDLQANWCLSEQIYLADVSGQNLHHYGTPKAMNPVCGANACTPNPCSAAPVADCADSDTRRSYANPGACEVVGGEARCTYAPTLTDCAANQVCETGACVDVVNPCDPNPCVVPPADVCDGNAIKRYAAVGTCRDAQGLAACDYTFETIACAEGQICQNALCVVPPLPKPVAGDVVFSEIMFDTSDPLLETKAEWFEIKNVSGHALTLEGCTVTDAANGSVVLNQDMAIDGLRFYARNAVAADNGGLTPDGTFSMSLNNTGDTLTLTCDGVAVDVVDYTTFDKLAARAVALDPSAEDAAANDLAASWCLARDVYYDNAPQHFGTPGRPNPACDKSVDWCRLQWPVDLDLDAGAQAVIYGRVYAQGLTDKTTGVDASDFIKAELGVGARGTLPTDASWQWTAAVANAGFNGQQSGEPNNDEYQAGLPLLAAGEYDHGFRFSYDRGRTWTYCDRDAGDGADGSEDGFKVATAGHLNVIPVVTPCEPNPCVAQPASECADGTTRRDFAAVGVCEAVNGEALCSYPPEDVACGANEICLAGACVNPCADVVCDTPPAPECAGDHGVTQYAAQGVCEVVNNAPVCNYAPVAVACGPTSLCNAGVCEDLCLPNPCAQPADECLDPNNVRLYDGEGICSIDDKNHVLCDYQSVDVECGAGNLCEGGTCIDDVCDPNPCVTPPPSECLTEATQLVYRAEGVCSSGVAGAVCEYISDAVACGANEICQGGDCVTVAVPPTLASVAPVLGATAGGEIVRLTGTGFAAGAKVYFGANESSLVDVVSANTIDVLTPPALRPGGVVSVRVVNPDNLEVTLANAFTYYPTPDQWAFEGPTDVLLAQGGLSPTFRGSFYMEGVTDVAGAAAGALAYIGYGPVGTVPSNAAWTWVAATYEADDAGGGDVYAAKLRILEAGEYDMAFRVTLDNGAHYAYGDLDGSINGFSIEQSGYIVVDAAPLQAVDWCKLQYPLDTTFNQGSTGTWYGHLYEAGLTDQTDGVDTNDFVRAQLGIGPDASDPAGANWTWTEATANPTWNDGNAENNNNDEYQASASPIAGIYDVAFRFSVDGGQSWTICDRDGGEYTNPGSLTVVPPGSVFFSEYVEGATPSTNRAVEIYNATGQDVPLALCSIKLYANGASTATNTTQLVGTLAAGDTFVVCNNAASAATLAACDLPTGNMSFNGDDALELICAGSTLDVFGQIGFDPGTSWTSNGVSTVDRTLRRKCGILVGDMVKNDAFTPDVQWDSYAVDTTNGLGSHTATCP